MKIKLILLCVSCMSFFHVSAQDGELSDTEKIMGLSRLWEGVKSNFVYYDQMQVDWDSLYEATIPKVLAVKDAYSYMRELDRFVAYARDGHTYIWYNVEPVRDERIMPLPFTTKLIGNKVLVDEVLSSDLVNKGVTRGAEVISVNNQDVFSYAKNELGQYIATSTPQWLYHKTMNSFELTKDKCIKPISVEFLNNGKKIPVSYPNRLLKWDIQEEQRRKQSLQGNQNNSNQTIEFTLLEGNIGLLTIHHFNDRNMNQLFDKLYLSVITTNGLIIDLRDNGGGNSGYADYILRHFSTKPIKTSSWSSRMYIPAHASWGYEDEWYSMASGEMKPVDKQTYTKPITVLVNGGTFSSAEDFCVKFRGMKRGQIIGTPTGGSTGNGVRVTLIKGLATANICAKKDIAPDGTFFVGVGVIPDIEIENTKESFLSNKDIVLEKAIQINRGIE